MIAAIFIIGGCWVMAAAMTAVVVWAKELI